MNKNLKIKDLMSLEEYSKQRDEIREKVLNHKKSRKIDIGTHVSLLFEDKLTITYQIQEMLRIEKIFEQDGIYEELNAYNPLIPNGDNWKATMLIQYPDEEERKEALALLVGIENKVWVKVGDTKKIYAISDEDLDRTRSDKTSSVHFLRFQMQQTEIRNIDHSTPIEFGIDHEHYSFNTGDIDEAIKTSLINDLD